MKESSSLRASLNWGPISQCYGWANRELFGLLVTQTSQQKNHCRSSQSKYLQKSWEKSKAYSAVLFQVKWSVSLLNGAAGLLKISFMEQAWAGSYFKLKNWHVSNFQGYFPQQTLSETQVNSKQLQHRWTCLLLMKILAAKVLGASPWHAAEWRCEPSWRGAAPCALLLHPTHPPLAPPAAAFTNEVFHPHFIFSPSKHPEAEVHFTGSWIIMFWFKNPLSFKKKNHCRFVLRKQIQPPSPPQKNA